MSVSFGTPGLPLAKQPMTGYWLRSCSLRDDAVQSRTGALSRTHRHSHFKFRFCSCTCTCMAQCAALIGGPCDVVSYTYTLPRRLPPLPVTPYMDESPVILMLSAHSAVFIECRSQLDSVPPLHGGHRPPFATARERTKGESLWVSVPPPTQPSPSRPPLRQPTPPRARHSAQFFC